jgi:hypothetical protein
MPAIVIELAVDNARPGPNHEPHPSVATTIIEKLPPTPKYKKRRTLVSIFTLPRNNTRSTGLMKQQLQSPL